MRKNDTMFDRKMTPKWPPKSFQNRPKIDLGTQDGPKMVQEGLREPIWTIFDRFWIDFESILDWILSEFGQNMDRLSSEFGAHFNSTNVNSAHINPPTSARHTSTQHTETNIWAGGTREAITISKTPKSYLTALISINFVWPNNATWCAIYKHWAYAAFGAGRGRF